MRQSWVRREGNGMLCQEITGNDWNSSPNSTPDPIKSRDNQVDFCAADNDFFVALRVCLFPSFDPFPPSPPQFSPLDTAGYVGFANLPNQVHRKSVKKGFEFTLMIVGESGLGKSTLVNSLFLTDLYPERVVPDAVGE
jgi:hypothetical protein